MSATQSVGSIYNSYSIYGALERLYNAKTIYISKEIIDEIPTNLRRAINQEIHSKMKSRTFATSLDYTTYYQKVLQEAVKNVASNIFDSLSPDRENEITQKVLSRSCLSSGKDFKSRREHVVNDIPILLQSMEEFLGKETPPIYSMRTNKYCEYLLRIYDSPLLFVKEYSLYALRYDIRQEIFRQIWDLVRQPGSTNAGANDIEFYALSSIPLLQKAIQKMVAVQFGLLSEQDKKRIAEKQHTDPLVNIPSLLKQMFYTRYMPIKFKEALDAWVAQGHLDHLDEDHKKRIYDIMNYANPSMERNKDEQIRLINGLGKALVHYWKLLCEIQTRTLTSSEFSAASLPDHLLVPAEIPTEESCFYKCEFKEYKDERIIFTLNNRTEVYCRNRLPNGDSGDFDLFAILSRIWEKGSDIPYLKISQQQYAIANFTLLDSFSALLPHKTVANIYPEPIIGGIRSFLAKYEGFFTPVEKQSLEGAILQLSQAQIFNEKAEVNFQETVDQIWDRVSSLNYNDSVLLLGEVFHHGFLFEITAGQEKDRLTIINTGNDESGALSRNFLMDRKSRFPFMAHKKYRYTDKAYDYNRGILTKEFIASILPPKTRGLTMKELLLQIDQSMKDLGAIEDCGRLHHPQGGPTCAYKRYTSWLKGWLIWQLRSERGNRMYACYKNHQTNAAMQTILEFESQGVSDRNWLKEQYDVGLDKEIKSIFQGRAQAMMFIENTRRTKMMQYNSPMAVSIESQLELVNQVSRQSLEIF